MAIIYRTEYETKLQERLDAPMVWKEVCDVKYTNTRVISNPYLTDATLGTGTRGTAYTSTAAATVDDTLTISTYRYCAQHIDRADLAQATFSNFMELAVNAATILNEGIEALMLAEHAQWTNLDNASIGGSAGNITVQAANVDLIVGAMKTAIRTAGGGDLMDRNGAFIVWRQADFDKLEAYARSQGYNTADDALKNGIKQGFRYMGVEHYASSKHTAGHVFGGVKKLFCAGVVKDTYGKLVEVENPVVGGGQISGIGLETRVDVAFKAWAKHVPALFDILVA